MQSRHSTASAFSIGVLATLAAASPLACGPRFTPPLSSPGARDSETACVPAELRGPLASGWIVFARSLPADSRLPAERIEICHAAHAFPDEALDCFAVASGRGAYARMDPPADAEALEAAGMPGSQPAPEALAGRAVELTQPGLRFRLRLRYDLLPDPAAAGPAAVLPVEVLDAQGRPLHSYRLQLVDAFASRVLLLDDALLYVEDCVGAGPGCEGRLHDPQSGARLGRLQGAGADTGPNMYGGHVLAVGQGRWLFISGDGAELLWIESEDQILIALVVREPAAIDAGTRAWIAGCPSDRSDAQGQCVFVAYGPPRFGDIDVYALREGVLLRSFAPQTCADES